MRVILLLPVALLACLAVAVGGFTAPERAPTHRPAWQPVALGAVQEPQSEPIARMERTLFERINRVRQSKGRRPLQWNAQLAQVARQYSRSRGEQGFAGHVDLSGRGAGERLAAAGLKYTLVGENLAQHLGAQGVVVSTARGWLDGPASSDNILSTGFTETAVGVWRSGDIHHVTQVFRRP